MFRRRWIGTPTQVAQSKPEVFQMKVIMKLKVLETLEKAVLHHEVQIPECPEFLYLKSEEW